MPDNRSKRLMPAVMDVGTFLQRFGTEEACWEHLRNTRWGADLERFACPDCRHANHFFAGRRIGRIPSAAQLIQRPVDLAIEHGLVADEPQHGFGVRQGGHEGAAGTGSDVLLLQTGALRTTLESDDRCDHDGFLPFPAHSAVS